jgi:hypothetical protein
MVSGSSALLISETIPNKRTVVNSCRCNSSLMAHVVAASQRVGYYEEFASAALRDGLSAWTSFRELVGDTDFATTDCSPSVRSCEFRTTLRSSVPQFESGGFHVLAIEKPSPGGNQKYEQRYEDRHEHNCRNWCAFTEPSVDFIIELRRSIGRCP